MENKKLFDLVKDALGDCERSDLVDAWNEIASEDFQIYEMSDFDSNCDEFDHMSPSNIVSTVKNNFDSFDLCDDFYQWDCGDCKSFDDPFDVIDEDELAQAVIDGEVEIDGIDLDELKKECCKLRAFKTKEEFKQKTGMRIGSQLIMRSKTSGALVEAAITAISILNSSTIVCIGIATHNFEELFNNWEYEENGEWLPFGIADETKDSANED